MSLSSSDYVWVASRIDVSSAPAPSDAKVRLGGMFSVSYAKAYAAAWQRLLTSSRELAIPILYLQRHTLELIVKDLIRSLLSTREEVQLHKDVFGPNLDDDAKEQADWDSDWERVNSKHQFELLFECLRKNLKLRYLPSLPDDFDKAKEMLEGVEEGDETRLRYDTVRQTKDGKKRVRIQRVRSFDDSIFGVPKVAPIGELSDVMTRIVSVHCRLGEFSDAPESILDHIAQDGELVSFRLREAVHDLEVETRSEKIVWRASREQPVAIESHLDLGDLDRNALCEEHLFAERDGRRFVILALLNGVTVRSAGETTYRDEYYLACADGTLSRIVVPFAHESDLVDSAIESWRANK